MRPTPFGPARHFICAGAIAQGEADVERIAPLIQLHWASLQDFRGLSAGIPNFAWVIPGGGVFCIPIFWAWVIPGGGVSSQLLFIPSVVANRLWPP